MYRFSLGDDENVQKLIRVTLSQLCGCAKMHCILYSKRTNCMVIIVNYTHTYISCSVCSILISLLLGYTAVEAIAAVTNNNNKLNYISINNNNNNIQSVSYRQQNNTRIKNIANAINEMLVPENKESE